jgi:hypothetical protein
MTVLVLCLGTLALWPQGKPEDPVLVADACGAAEGAPPAENLGKLVLLTDVARADPWYAVVEFLQTAKQPAAVLDFPPGKVEAVRDGLARELPEFAIVVSPPDHLDVNTHFALVEMTAGLDPDPFVDCAFGYVTGATHAEALAFAKRFVELQAKKAPLPRTLFDFGPIAQGPPQFGGPMPHPLGKGWKRTWAYHGPVAELLQKKGGLAGFGVLHAGGHGMPWGIDGGLQGKDLRSAAIDLAPALYFSGPCYCGVTSGWFDPRSGAVQRAAVAPEESFALAAIAQGVSALFAGFDPDRGETCEQELEHLLVHGDALGHAIKETWDGVAVARRASKFALVRYETGKPLPHQGIVDTMTCGGASRALFGDPSWRPLQACAEPLFAVKSKDTAKALELSWSAKRVDASHWSTVDVYRCDGGWTHRIAFRLEIPVATARALTGLAVAQLTARGKPLPYRWPTAIVERFGGKAFLHVYLVFPPAGQQNTFFVERDFDLRLVLAKTPAAK